MNVAPSADAARALVERSTAASCVPPQVEDLGVLAMVAEVMSDVNTPQHDEDPAAPIPGLSSDHRALRRHVQRCQAPTAGAAELGDGRSWSPRDGFGLMHDPMPSPSSWPESREGLAHGGVPVSRRNTRRRSSK